LIHLVSFAFVAIYWINHHNLLTAARRVTASLAWANTTLLFSLSLTPFATAYVGATHMAPFPMMVCGALQFALFVLVALAYVVPGCVAKRAQRLKARRGDRGTPEAPRSGPPERSAQKKGARPKPDALIAPWTGVVSALPRLRRRGPSETLRTAP